MNYQPNIPTGTLNLSVDYQNLRSNFQALDTIFGVDHVPYSNATAQKGYHESIHFNPVSTTSTNPTTNYPPAHPGAISGYGQLMSAQVNDGLSTDTALYFLTGAGILQQLTSNVAPSVTANGYTFIPGGLLLQWGQVSIGSTASFPRPFSATPFGVYTTFTRAGSISSNHTLAITSVSTTGFSYSTNLGGSPPTGFYWIAIGH